MIIKTLRDAEIALNRMQAEIDALKRGVKPETTIIQRETITQAAQPSSTQIINEVDSYLHGSEVYHKLPHIFESRLTASALAARTLSLYESSGPGERWNFTASPVGQLRGQYFNLTTGEVFEITYHTAATLSDAEIEFVGKIGNSSTPVEEMWANSLKAIGIVYAGLGVYLADPTAPTDNWYLRKLVGGSFKLTGNVGTDQAELVIIPGATNADALLIYVGSIGDATDRVEKLWVKDLDVSGTVTGISGGAGTIAQANASSNLVLTTSWQDIPGASLSLTANGDYLIIGTFAFTIDANDSTVDGQLVHDDSGSFVAETGNVQYYKSTTDIHSNIIEKGWKVTIASQPTTIKLQGKKPGGTGSSGMLQTNSSILAIKIT